MTMPYNLPLTYAVKNMAINGDVPVISWSHDSAYFYSDYPEIYDHEPWNILKTMIPCIHYICISHSRCEQFYSLFNTNKMITVVPNGIDPLDFFQLSPDSQQIIKEQKLFDADLIMVQPSRLIPRKNFELGLNVVHALKEKGSTVRYLITGSHDPHEPQNRKYYRELKGIIRDLDIKREVLFIADYRTKTGEKIVPNQLLIRDLYFVADILFMPTTSEGFGLPLIEAGMIKLPIACTNIPAFLEIGDRSVCFFSPQDSPRRIADKILKFLQSITTHTMYRNVVNNYMWDSIYRNHIRPLLAKTKRG